MRRPLITLSLLSLALPLVVASPASAAPTPEAEPNDTIFQVTATANTEGLAGTIGASGDVDYFWLGLRPQRQVKILASISNCGTSYYTEVDVSINPKDGGGSNLAYLAPEPNAPTKFTTTTTPGVFGGPTQYFLVKVQDDDAPVGCTYTVQVQNASGGTTDAIDPAPPATFPVTALSEPDDLPAQAHGPLGGEINYSGTINTSNDVDQVYFLVKAGAAVNARLSVGVGSVDAASADLYDLSASAGNYDITTTPVETQDKGYSFAITGTVGSTYQLLLTPGTSLGTTPPPPPPPPAPPFFDRDISIKRKPGAYVGIVQSAEARCEGATVVKLRQKGRSGVIGKATTSTSGQWRIRSRKLRNVYVAIKFTSRDGYECGSARSRVLRRGR